MSRRRIASCAATGLQGTFAFIEAPVENKGRACCNDCGVDTAPMRKRKLGRWETGRWEWYSVHSSVWAQAGMEPHGGFLCIGCLETRLGRQLCQDDFPPRASISRVIWIRPDFGRGGGPLIPLPMGAPNDRAPPPSKQTRLDQFHFRVRRPHIHGHG